MKNLLVLLFVLVGLRSLGQRQNLIVENTFEENIYKDWNRIDTCYDLAYTPSVYTKRAGNQSAMFFNAKGDTAYCDKGMVQVSLRSNDQVNYSAWYGLSFYLGDGYLENTYESPEHIVSFNRRDTTGLSPLTIDYNGLHNMLTLVQTVKKPNSDEFEIIHWNLDSIPLATWSDLVFNIKWSDDSTGYIKLWLNDSLKLFIQGPNNYTPNYLGLGIEKMDWKRKLTEFSASTYRALFVDEFRIGNDNASYADVVPNQNFVVLPVHYTRELTGKKVHSSVVLDWGAEVMSNFNRFEVERSQDGFNFTKIGQVKGNTTNNYTFTDPDPLTINYYRLRDINNGELDKFSRTIVIKFNLAFTKVYVYDILGKLVSVVTASDLASFKMHSHLAAGIYVMQYDNGDTEKIYLH